MQVRPDLSTDFDSQLVTWAIASFALAISFLSFGVSALALYLQRRDKKPRLRISIVREFVKAHRTGESGGTIYYPVPGLKVYARNPTERPIKIASVHFLDTQNCYHALPETWGTLREIPAQDFKTIDISITEFNKWAGDMNLVKPEKGRFVITDALDYKYKTTRVGKASLEPVKKIETGISLDI